MSEWNNIERDALIDEILSQVSNEKNKNNDENKSSQSREDTLSRVDDILAELFPKNDEIKRTDVSVSPEEERAEISAPIIKETPVSNFTSTFEQPIPSEVKEEKISDKKEKAEKKRKRRKKEEKKDVLSEITPWDERRKMHEGGEADSFEDMAGHKKVSDFYSELKNRASVEQEKVVEEVVEEIAQNNAESNPPFKEAEEIIVKKYKETAKVLVNNIEKEDTKIEDKDEEPLEGDVKVFGEDNAKTASEKDTDESFDYDFEPTKYVPDITENYSEDGTSVDSRTIVMDSLPSEPESEIQLKLPGFDKTSEDTIKGEFVKRRREVVEQFEVDPDALPPEEPVKVNDDEDYHGIEDAESVRLDLLLRSRQMNISHITTVVLALISTIFTVCALPGVAVFNMDEIAEIYLAINLVIMLIAIVVNGKTILGSIMGLVKKNNPNGTAGASLALLVGVVINAVLFAFVSDFANAGLPIFNFLYLWAFSFVLAGEKANANRIRNNFELIANEKEKTVVSVISGGENAEDIASNLAIGTPEVAVTRKGVHLKRFLYHSLAQDEGDMASYLMSYAFLPLAIIVGIICFFFPGENARDVIYALTAFSGATAMLVPFAGILAGGKIVAEICKILRKERIMISGYDAAEICENVNVIALNAADLFPAGTVKLVGVKTTSTQAIDRSLQDVAAVMIADGGPLAHEFRRIVEDKLSILPNVEAPVYEDGMGVSGWVSGKRVLVGNKALMDHHEIHTPNYNFEEEAAEKGLSAVYLSTEGKFAAVFFVKYTASRKVAEYLKKAVDKGMSINVCSNDPFINHDMLCRLFSLPSKTVKLMDTTARKAYKNALTDDAEALNAVMMHTGNAGSTARVLTSGKKMKKICKYIAIMQYVLTAIAMIVSCACVIIGGAEALGVLVIVGQYLVSLLLALGIPSLTIE